MLDVDLSLRLTPHFGKLLGAWAMTAPTMAAAMRAYFMVLTVGEV